MRDRIELQEERSAMWNRDADRFRFAVTLMSIGPVDERWFDENAPGWREHCSLRDVYAEHAITGYEQIMATNPREIIDITRRMLGRALADELISHMEPVISRYHHGERVRV